jgi:hypothetical protein
VNAHSDKFLIQTGFMRGKTRKTKDQKKEVKTRSGSRNSHEFETMSQIQNRYGKGRQVNGSDGGSSLGRGSNH